MPKTNLALLREISWADKFVIFMPYRKKRSTFVNQ